jgi:hypothetical protein
MEKQMRADRDKRAAILTAEGIRQSQILTAEGEKQSAILRAEGEAKAAALKAEGEAQAIRTVFESIHAGDPDQKLLAYQYLQMLPKIAEGDANKLWIVPSEIGDALKGLGNAVGRIPGIPHDTEGPRTRVDYGEPVADVGAPDDTALSTAQEQVAEAIASAEEAAKPTRGSSASSGPGTTPGAPGDVPQPPAGQPPADDEGTPPAQPPNPPAGP